MRAIQVGLALVAALATTEIGSARAQSPAAFTRAQINRLSPQEGAKQILGAGGGLWSAVDGAAINNDRQYEFAPPPPWLSRVSIDLPVRPVARGDPCVREAVNVQFERPGMTFEQSIRDQNDTPAVVTDAKSEFWFADSGVGDPYKAPVQVDCRALPKDAWFAAKDKDDAWTAIRAFRLFKEAAAKNPRDRMFRCRVVQPAVETCRGAADQIRSVTRIYDLFGVIREATGDMAEDYTIVVRVSRSGAEWLDELRLTLHSEAASERLVGAVLTHTPPPPPI